MTNGVVAKIVAGGLICTLAFPQAAVSVERFPQRDKILPNVGLTEVFNANGNPVNLDKLPKPKPRPSTTVPSDDFFSPASPISYSIKPDGRVSMTLLDVDVAGAKADAKIKASVDNLVAQYAKNAAAEQQVYDDANASAYYPGKDAAISIADDERLLADLNSEARFYDDLILISRVAGIGALGAGASYLASLLHQSQGMPQGRLAFVLTSIAGAVANGYVKVLEEKRDFLKNEAVELEQHIDNKFNYLLWAADFGGDTTVTFRPPTCIYKNSCGEYKVCVRSGLFGAENCRYQEYCVKELLTCRNE